MLNAQNVLKVHSQVFYGALMTGDLDTLSTLYSDDYKLARSDGSMLNKTGVLGDLRDGGLAFTSIMLCIEEVRLFGTAAMVIGKSRATSTRGGLTISTRFRLVAVYEQIDATLRLAYFHSTDLADHTFANAK